MAYVADVPADVAVKPDKPAQPPYAPVAGGEDVALGAVILAVCKRGGQGDAILCRKSTSGAYRPTGRTDDLARALHAGMIVIPGFGVLPKPAAAGASAPKPAS